MFDTAKAVFVGTAIASKPFGPTRYRIEEAITGIQPGMHEIDVGAATCDLTGAVGEKYLVIVHQFQTPRDHGFSDFVPIEEAAEYIDFARRLVRGESVTTINGWTAANVPQPIVRFKMEVDKTPGLSGVEITAAKDGKQYRTSSVAGRFHLPVPQPGTYRVTATYAGYASTDEEYEAEVRPRSCAELEVSMMTASRVRGRITGSDGRPLPNLKVQMDLAPESGHFSAPVLTDIEGRFEFTKIPPGEYVVLVEMEGRFPYATRYYPGVSSTETARKIHIDGPQTIEGIDFSVQEPKLTRTITATVRWPDGQPVTNARVSCAIPDSPAKPATLDSLYRYTDSNGKVACEILADRAYEIEADTLYWKSPANDMRPIDRKTKVSVPAGTTTTDVTIVLDKTNDLRRADQPISWEFFNRSEDSMY